MGRGSPARAVLDATPCVGALAEFLEIVPPNERLSPHSRFAFQCDQVNLHGWAFFLWYGLLPLQAGLISFRRVSVHRVLGKASALLALAMVLTGLVVVGTQMELARQPGGSPFWQFLGPAAQGLPQTPHPARQHGGARRCRLQDRGSPYGVWP